ncbi:hypothetical protein BvCmsKKNP024_00918 [Escherichia coli]|nr:hypothetical protein BvCmsKKNP024_00918 [Escherichia coli]
MYFPLIHYGIIYCDTLLSHPQKHLPKRKLTAGQSFAVTNGAIVIHTQRLKSDPGGNLLS